MKLISNINPSYHCGGKANNLFVLQDLGFNVPRFVVIPGEVSDLFSKTEDDLLSAIAKYLISDEDIQQIASSLNDPAFYAVRSSAVDEDGNTHSFAGQFESYLFVTREQLANKIKCVWASANSERVKEYRTINQLPKNASIAVIIQEMIDADTAGVAFGIHPISGHRKEKVINAVYGIGEGLVSGELNADNYIIDEKGSVQHNIAVKTHRFSLNLNLQQGTQKIAVPIELIGKPCLSNVQIMEVKNALHRLFVYFKTYQDIEFAYKNDVLYLLQSRPITTLNSLPDTSSEQVIWDNSNIIESYPGITSPLTFSFITEMYEAVYRQFVALMGVSERETEENKYIFSNMLGLIDGRVYYNLLSWYKALALLPGYSINAGFMEKMMGVKERFELKDLKRRNKTREQMRVIKMLWMLLWNLLKLPALRLRFKRDIDSTLRDNSAIDYSEISAHEIMYLYMKFEQSLLKKWKAPLVNDFFAMIYFGLLQKLTIKLSVDKSGSLQNDLLSGAKDIISTEPIRLSLHICKLIQEDANSKKLFCECTAREIEGLYLSNKLPAKIQSEIDEYLRIFGNRCVGELKLETITYKQNPSSFIQILKSYVLQGITIQNQNSDVSTNLRILAEQRVNETLKRKPLKLFLFNHILKRTRILVSARENLRYERTRAFGVVRELFCELGNRFYAGQIIAHPRDIFYLTKQESFDYIKGTSVNYKLKDLIAIRKKQFNEFEKTVTAERIDTRGIVYAGNKFSPLQKNDLLNGDLKGIGCCPGRVKGKVQIVNDPNDVVHLNGDILVTSSTDPGWVCLFPTASAILVERGSMLSHSAIVSREMGIPCIVGITGLLDRLKTGDNVEIDGSTGEIKLPGKSGATTSNRT